MDDKIWRRAAACDNSSGSCVEVADLGEQGVLVRDSKDADGPRLNFSREEWDVFAAGIVAGDFR